MAESNGAAAGTEEALNAGPPAEGEARSPGQRGSVRGSLVDADGALLAAGLGRGNGPRAAKEVVDELAHDTQRSTLLDAIENQLRDREHVSRLLFVCQVTDEKRVHSQIERDFQNWLGENDAGKELGGLSLLLAVSPTSAIVSFMEGSTEKLFGVLKFFDEMSTDGGEGRPALVSNLRVVYFTEMHKVKSIPTWVFYSHATKLGGQNQGEVNLKSTVFLMYKKLLTLAAKVKVQTKDEAAKENAVKNVVKNSVDLLPLIDEALLLSGKVGAEYLFSYKEFEKTFVAPFHTVLQSELLWPMPPPLSY